MPCLDIKLSTVRGVQAVESHDASDTNMLIGVFFLGMMLIVFGWRVLFSARARALPASLLRYVMFLYCAGTGLFAFARGIWDISRVLISFAAIHNMMEWGIIAHVLFCEAIHKKSGTIYPYKLCFGAGVLLTWTVLSLVCILPPTKEYFLVGFMLEQVTGLWCDYILAFAFVYLRFFHRPADPQLRSIYNWGMIAHITHFGQIYPLIISGMLAPAGMLGVLNELVQYVSSLITFFCDTEMALEWDEQLLSYNKYQEHLRSGGMDASDLALSVAPKKTPSGRVTRSTKRKEDADNKEAASPNPAHDSGVDSGDALHRDGPAEHRAPSTPFFNTANAPSAWTVIAIFGVCFFLSAVTILGPPALMGICPDAVTVPVTGTTLITVNPDNHKAFRDKLEVMVEKAHKNPDNVEYNLYDWPEGGSFLFIETWKSLAALDTWLAGPDVNSVFTPDFKKQFTSATLSGPWINVKDDTLLHREEFTATVSVDFATFWAAVDNMNNVDWIQGAQSVKVLPGNSRLIFMDNTKYTQNRDATDQPNTFVSRGSPWRRALAYRSTLTLAPRTGGTFVRLDVTFVPADLNQKDAIIAEVHNGLASWFNWMKNDMKLTAPAPPAAK